MNGKLRIQLKQPWFWRPYPVLLNGQLLGTLTDKNREVTAFAHPGQHELQIKYHGVWMSYAIEIARENEVIHLHIIDNGLRLRKPATPESWMQGLFSGYFILYLWGLLTRDWSYSYALPLVAWLVWQTLHGKPVGSSLKIERFNPNRS